MEENVRSIVTASEAAGVFHPRGLAHAIVASFKMARSHTIFFAVLRIDHRGEKARARVRRTDKLVTRDGQTVTAGTLIEISFSKVGDGAWQIDSMAKANPPS